MSPEKIARIARILGLPPEALAKNEDFL